MNILLDLDGTLTDPKEGMLRCFKHALTGLGAEHPSDEALEGYIGPPLENTFEDLLGNDPGKIAKAIALYRQRFSSVGLFENAVYPEIPAALGVLCDSGAILFVATSKPTIFAERIVEHFGLGNHIRAVYGSELDGTRSDKTELIAHILKAEALSPAATCMVGDRKYDMIGAKGNAVFAVGALWGYGSRRELIEAGAAAVCESPVELGEILSSGICQ